MGFSGIDTGLIFVNDLKHAVMLTKENDSIVFDGHMMFAGSFGHYQSKSWYFICLVNDQEDCILERQNCDAGEGWFLYRWTCEKPHNVSSFDDCVHKTMCSFNSEWNEKYMALQKSIHPISITPNDNPVCRNIQNIIDKGYSEGNEAFKTDNAFTSDTMSGWIE